MAGARLPSSCSSAVLAASLYRKICNRPPVVNFVHCLLFPYSCPHACVFLWSRGRKSSGSIILDVVVTRLRAPASLRHIFGLVWWWLGSDWFIQQQHIKAIHMSLMIWAWAWAIHGHLLITDETLSQEIGNGFYLSNIVRLMFLG